VVVVSSEPLSSGEATLVGGDGLPLPLGTVLSGDRLSLSVAVPTSGVGTGRGSLRVVVVDLAGNAAAWVGPVDLGEDPYLARADSSTLFAATTWTTRRYEALASDTPYPPPWSAPMTTRERQAYSVGEVVYLRVRVTDPEDGTPVDPHLVTLDSLSRRPGAVVVSSGDSFTRARTGLFYLAVDTTDLTPGTYDWVARLLDETGMGTTLPGGYLVLTEAG
jgi:hypothetical protein